MSDVRSSLDRDDIVLCDTGAAKMWMARLYPTYRPNTCLISNGLATMAFSLPGAVAAKLVHPERKVLAAMGDGAFLMSVAEIETAVREGVHFVVLVWVDGGYGLIGWKQDIHSRTSCLGLVRQSRLRAAGGELRRARVSDRIGRGTPADAAQGPGRRRGLGHRVPGRLPRERPADRTPRRAHRADLSAPRGTAPGA